MSNSTAGLWRQFESRELGGRYRLDRFLASGAMGGVFQARDLRLRRDVAVKIVLYPAGRQPEEVRAVRRRFAREAESAAQIPDPSHVVAVYDSGSADDLDFLVMELLQGSSLAEWLERNPNAPMTRRLEIVRQAALGLAAGHAAGIVHRDLKPSNLFLVAQENGIRVKVVDFGIAKPLQPRDPEGPLTQPGVFVGTPSYASPEQLRGSAVLTPASDVFSLGVLAYLLLTGRNPFTQQDRTRLANGSPVHVASPGRFNEAVPDAVSEVVLQALRVNPAHRYPDASAFADAWSAAVRGAWSTRPAPSVSGDLGGATIPQRRRRPIRLPDLRWASEAAAWLRRPSPGRRRGAIAVGAVASVALLVQTGVASAGGAIATSVADFFGGPTAEERRAEAQQANAAGRALLRQGDGERAVHEFRRAVELAPDHEEYANNLGYALHEAGEVEEAVKVLEDVVRRFPDRAVAHNNLAGAYLARGDTAEAIEHLQHYVDRAPAARTRWERNYLRRLRERTAPNPAPVPASGAPLPAFETGKPGPAAASDSDRSEPAPRTEAPPREPDRREAADEPVRRITRPGSGYRDTLRIGGRGTRPSSGGYRDTLRIGSPR